MMRPVFIMLILIVISMVATWMVYFPVLRIAREKNLTDAPSERKLQKSPVSLLGGVAVFFGIVIGLCFFKTTIGSVDLFSTLGAMMIMLYIGTMDDILDIPAWLKFTIEILVSLLVVYGTRSLMCNFQGVLGIERLGIVPAMILSCVAMVGIVNAINLIDGVDGLASGFCIFANACFGLFFFFHHEYSYAALAFISLGAMIPFFIHNLFGKQTKMYLGDGGSLMMGVVFAAMCLRALNGKGFKYEPFDLSGFSLMAFCLSVLSVPVFDTLRVMTMRMVRGRSPFSADRTHLHHLLMDAGLSPVGTLLVEIGADAVVVGVLLLCQLMQVSLCAQLVSVCIITFLIVNLLPSVLKSRLGQWD